MVRLAAFTSVLVVLAVCAAPASASHFRSGNLSWQKSSSVANGVTFQNTQAWRRSSFSGQGTGTDGYPVTGDVVDNSEGCIVPGDDTGELCPQYLVTFTNVAEDYIVMRALAPNSQTDFSVPYQYPGPGPFTAITSSCCTIEELMNSAGSGWQVDSLVDFTDSESPRSSVPPIVNLPSGGVQQYRIPATDPGGQTLRFRLSGNPCTTPEEAQSCTEPPGLTIDENSGVVSWDTTGAATGSGGPASRSRGSRAATSSAAPTSSTSCASGAAAPTPRPCGRPPPPTTARPSTSCPARR